MPGFAAPHRIADSMVFKAKFLIHLNLIREAGQDQLLSSLNLFSFLILFHQFSCQSLVLVLRQHIQSKEHNICTSRIMLVSICKKVIRQMFPIRCQTIQKSCHLSGFSVHCHQKKIRCIFDPWCHVLICTSLIWWKTDCLNFHCLFNLIPSDIAEFIFLV